MPAAVRVGEHLAGLGVEAVRSEGLRGGSRLARVEHVEVPASPPERDDLPAERRDHVDVVRLEVTEHQRHDPVTREARRHSSHKRRLAEPRLAEDERRRVADEFRPLEPRDGVAAERRASLRVPAEWHADHGRSRPDRERPEPAHLDGGSAPLVRRLDVGGCAASGPDPPAHPWPFRGPRTCLPGLS